MSTSKETEGNQSDSAKSSSDASGNVEKEDEGRESGAASKDTSNEEEEAKAERTHSQSDLKAGVSRGRQRSTSKPLSREEVQKILSKCYPYNQYRQRRRSGQRKRTPRKQKRAKEDDNDDAERNEDTEEDDQEGNQDDRQRSKRKRNRDSSRKTERKKGKSEESDDSLESSVRDAQKTMKRRRRRRKKSRKRKEQEPEQEEEMGEVQDAQEEMRKLSETSVRRGYRRTPLSQRERENADILRRMEMNRRREEAKQRVKWLRENMKKLSDQPRDETGDEEDSKDRLQRRSRRNKDNVLPLPSRGGADTKQYGESSGGRYMRPRRIKRVEVPLLPGIIKRSRSGSPRGVPRKKRKRPADEAVYPKFRRVPRKQTNPMGGEYDVDPAIPREVTRRSRPTGRALHPLHRLRRSYRRRKGKGVADDSQDTKEGICEDNVHGAYLKRKNPDSVHYARIPRKRRKGGNMNEMRMPNKREEVAEWLDNNEGNLRKIARRRKKHHGRHNAKRLRGRSNYKDSDSDAEEEYEEGTKTTRRNARKRRKRNEGIDATFIKQEKCEDWERYGRDEVDLRKRRQGKRNENVLKDPSRNVRRKRDHRRRNRYPAVSTNIKSERAVLKEDTCPLESYITPMRTLRMTPRRLQQLEERSSSAKKQEELKKAVYVHGSLSSIGLEFITPSETDDEATNAERTQEKSGVNSLEARNKLHLNQDIFVNKSINPARAVPLFRNAVFRNASKESDFSSAIAKQAVILPPTRSAMEQHSLLSTTSSNAVPNEYTFQPFAADTSGKELKEAASRVLKNSEILRRCRPRSTKVKVYEGGEKQRRRVRKAITCYYDSENSSDDDQPCPLCKSRKRRPCDEYRAICRQRHRSTKRKKWRRYPLMMVPIPSVDAVTKQRRRRAQLRARTRLRGIKSECGEEDEGPAAKARARRLSRACAAAAARAAARTAAARAEAERCAERCAELRAAQLRRSRRRGEADGEQCEGERRRTRTPRSTRPCQKKEEEDDDEEEEDEIVIEV